MPGGGSKPGERRGGRQKGTPNKTTTSVKSALIEAFEKMGGVKAFAKWGQENPTEFYKLYVKMLPQEVHASGPNGAPLPAPIIRIVRGEKEPSTNGHG